jgi:nucleoside-diphosphate-sugar epimerase
MKALVTGGGGFLGRYIVEQLLARGDQVTVFTRGAYPELADAGALVVRGDLQDTQAVRAACEGIEVVYHVASKTGYWGTRESFYGANVAGTQNVIAACQTQGVPKLVYTSTPSVVFDNRPHEGCDESLPYAGHYESFYAETKAIAERMVRDANDMDGLLTVSLRPHLIFGPRDPHIIPRVIARAGKGFVPQIGDGTNVIDLTYVEDAARAHLLAADALAPGSPAAGSVYFITQGDPVKAWEWLNTLLVSLGYRPVRGKVSLSAALVACTFLEFIYRVLPLKGEPPISRLVANELAMSHYYDISRAKRDLGYHPQLGTYEALQRTVAYLKGTPADGTTEERE